jgi:glycosyltransferase involved in cell wall biosynthesis
MKISVAMATYNGGKYLDEQLESLATQTLLPTELVVGDDGSTDDTLHILDAFAKTAPFPVRIERNPARLGYRANFMAIVRRCRGDLISFCDQDDIWHPEKLELVAKSFDDPDVLLTFHNSRLVTADRRPISPFYAEPPMPPKADRLTLSPWLFSFGFSQTFRAELVPASVFWSIVKDHVFPKEAMGHDLFFFLIASGLGCICYIQEELADYRQHAGNLFGSGKRSRPSLPQRLRNQLEIRACIYRNLSDAAPLDAALFQRLAELPAFRIELRARAAEAVIAWGELEQLYRDRASACSGSSLERISAFARLLRRGAYGESSFWTFGRTAMAKDFIFGVLLGPLVNKFGFERSKTDHACRRGRRKTRNSYSANADAARQILN